MDATVHRTAKAESREPVNGGVNIETEALRPASPPLAADGPIVVPVAEGYDRWAAVYDDVPNPLLAREERHLLPLLMGLQDKQVLDLACGTGRWLEKLLAKGIKSGVGIDCSVAMLRVAGKKSAITGRLAQAVADKLPFRGVVFDLAICSFALGHIRDLTSIVRELARVTKPGADVFVSDLHPEAYGRGWRVGFRYQGSAIQIEMLPRPVEEIVQAFYANGFECLTYLPLCLGSPEKPIFAQAGRIHAFVDACQIPAVLVCHFKRLEWRADDYYPLTVT